MYGQQCSSLQFYENLKTVVNILIVETNDIMSKGMLFIKKDFEYKIYIKQDLDILEKIIVLIHKCSHYIHLTKYYENESRAECEIIVEASAFFICKEFGINKYV